MVALGEEEGKLRKGEAYDFIRVLQTVCKTLSALKDRKRVDEAGQHNHTIAGDQVLDTRDRRGYFIESYNAVRTALISLRISDATHPEGAFPHLTIAQTFMKSRRRKRALGDSRRGDGLLFMMTGVASGSKIAYPPQDNENDSTDSCRDGCETAETRQAYYSSRAALLTDSPLDGSTQMTKRKKPPAERKKDKQALQAAYDADLKNKNGWLWELRKPTNEEMKQWEEEGDRVQWARAEADMDRFQEQMEAKLAEFLRCSVAFQTNAENWTKMSAQVERGYGEYARQTTAMWLRLVNQSEDHLCKAGYKFALKQDFNLVDYLESERDKHDSLLRDRGLGYFDFSDKGDLGTYGNKSPSATDPSSP
ncbi:hypothetical protein C8J57DRAFT_1534519 [Mycena rebaudengoi]|nr:hypothetical protein C8J57DRAFT_1534519 [Mycena rebaudengoi]